MVGLKTYLSTQSLIGSNRQQTGEANTATFAATTAGSSPQGFARRFITLIASSSSTVMKASAVRERTRQATREGS